MWNSEQTNAFVHYFTLFIQRQLLFLSLCSLWYWPQSYFVITVQTTVTLTMCFIVYTHIQSFLNIQSFFIPIYSPSWTNECLCSLFNNDINIIFRVVFSCLYMRVIFFSLRGFILVRFFPCTLLSECVFFPMRSYTYALFSGALFSYVLFSSELFSGHPILHMTYRTRASSRLLRIQSYDSPTSRTIMRNYNNYC